MFNSFPFANLSHDS